MTKDKWENSYRRGENYIFYPKEQVVMFLNRFVRKRIALDGFKDIMDFSREVKALDYGCGIGRQTLLLKEFGIDAWGVDISQEALSIAKQSAKKLKYPELAEKFLVIEGDSLSFSDNFFDLTISDGVLDSMPFELARKIVKDISRVTKKYVFVSLICGIGSRQGFDGEEIVEHEHEQGTVQSYFTQDKITKLIERTKLSIKWCRLVKEEDTLSDHKTARYFIVFEKN